MSFLFPLIYSAALTYLVWKAFKVMSNGWAISSTEKKHFYKSNLKQKKFLAFIEYLIMNGLVEVDFFDKKQKHVAVLNSFKAEVDQKTNNMKAVGNVIAISDSGITLYTETLYWDSKNEKMSTEDSVMITTLEKDTLYGIGFESDSDLENWKILNPSGVTERN